MKRIVLPAYDRRSGTRPVRAHGGVRHRRALRRRRLRRRRGDAGRLTCAHLERCRARRRAARRRSARHADRDRRPRRARCRRRRRAGRLGPPRVRPRAPNGVRLHRRVPARRGGTARRAPGHHALGSCDVLRRTYPEVESNRTRSSCATASRHLGRSHRRDRSGARAGRGGPRPRRRARCRALAGDVPTPAGWSVAVQRAASRVRGRARAAARPQDWIADNPAADLSVAALAGGVASARARSPGFSRARSG